ncbi:winged helix family two component transcriptional regulator [Hydrogenispora ethanolica]|uniref:Winged helix family two component transcriptional regulator n=1 Tax=Hydrogenispora ethanolica TaxID=1082276 RepID=A0A4R1R346_HYDET|nr:winged helix family two component transcriptional regulator [Hydrogenispora ethanolica]
MTTIGLKILVVDDDPMIANSLKRVLTYEGFQTEVSNDGAAALETVDRFRPGLVILDVTMPGLSGIEVCKRLKAKTAIPVLFLSARDDIGDRVAGLDSGGDDYLIKPFAYEELLARVRALLRRNGNQPEPPVLSLGELALDTATHTASRNGRSIALSTTEYQLLYYLMTNPRRLVTKGMILEAVWGYDFGGESNIVEVYIRYLRNKLEQDGATRLIHTVRGSGYILKE